MEYKPTQTASRATNFSSLNLGSESENDLVQARLNKLLAVNAEIEREKKSFRDEQEKLEAELMKNPIATETSLAYFGAMLGLFPPFAIFSRIIFEKFRFPGSSDDFWLIPLLLFVNLVCVTVGYFSGKLIGKIVKDLEKISWTKMLLATPFIGILWGLMTGAAGGVFIFVIGAFVGAVIASAIGSLALPAFTIFHRLLKKGEMIEEKHFFPIALGVTGIITAFILGW